MIAELAVLLGIEDLEQGCRGIAAEIRAELVDLVEHHHGIARTGLLDALDDASRERADVGPAMAPDLRLVANAAERDPYELATHRARDRTTERRLADARRAREAEDRPARVLAELADAEELEDAILHDRQMRMIPIEDRARVVEPEPIDRLPIPGQIDDPVEIVPDDLGLGAVGMHPLEATQLAHRLFTAGVRQIRLFDLEPIVVELVGARVDLAELALDRAQLFAQEGLAVVPGRLLRDRAMEIRPRRRRLEIALEKSIDTAQPGQGILDLEDLLGFLESQPEIRRDEVGEPAGALDVGRDREDLGREVLQRQQLFDPRSNGPGQRLAFDRPFVAAVFGRGEGRDANTRALRVFDHRLDAGLAESLHQDLEAPVGHLEGPQDRRDGADAVEVVRIRIDRLGIALRHEQDQAVAALRLFDGRDRMASLHEERKHHVREDDEFAKREDRKLFRKMVGRGRAFHGSISGCERVDLRREIRFGVAS